MGFIIDFFAGIATSLVSLVQFVFNTIKGLLSLLLSLPQLVSFLTTSFAFLPSVLIPFATATVALFIIKFIVDR